MEVFAEAIARVRVARPEVLGVIVGGVHELEAGYETELRQIIAGLGQEESDGIRMVGKQRNVPQWMMAMDIVVHASDREPFGIVVVEAMALGKPVIASKPGGPEEIIDDGVDGLLTSYGDVEALAAAMNRYLEDAEFSASHGRAAREKAMRFSPERYAERVGEALRKLIG
jgi:glycosyltransferase involved in cell wall biosynthesis